MYRFALSAAAIAAVGLAACGSNGTAAPAASASAGALGNGSAATRLLGRNGAAGELVKLNSGQLVLSTQAGDVTVVTSGATTVTRTRTGLVADIVPGACVALAGQKDAAGALTATAASLSPAVNGACPAPGRLGAGIGRGTGTGTPPSPRAGPRPTPRPDAFVTRGIVTAVTGTAVTVQAMSGTSQTVTVPTTVRVSVSAAATTADLSIGDCVLAVGAKDSAGAVTATSLSIVPAGPSGCFTGGGGRGGFGGGGFGFGGGAGGGGGVSATAPPSA